jgi:nitroreductase
MNQANSQGKANAKVTAEVAAARSADYDVDAMFLNRWSPRAFSPEPIEEETLMRAFEAARWAPSSNNEQPWRFIVARTPEDRKKFYDFLTPGNQAWNTNVPVLVVAISKKTFTRNGKPNTTNRFDAGCAWGFLSLGAHQNGLITHGMAGFDRDKARRVLEVPDDFDIPAMIAIGKRGELSELPPEVQQKEKISDRRPLEETIMEGTFQS